MEKLYVWYFYQSHSLSAQFPLAIASPITETPTTEIPTRVTDPETSVTPPTTEPSIPEAPRVGIAGSGSAGVGSSYTLTCTVTLPTEVAVTPDVQWAGPGLSGDTTGTVTGSDGTYTSELSLNPLSPSHGGDYTCTAAYTADG